MGFGGEKWGVAICWGGGGRQEERMTREAVAGQPRPVQLHLHDHLGRLWGQSIVMTGEGGECGWGGIGRA